MPEKSDDWLRKVLSHLDTTRRLGSLYYPGSGFHRIPLETLGADRVYHVSAEEIRGMPDFNPEVYGEEWRPVFENGYFGKLGEDAIHTYEGDYRHTPFFEEGKFDSTLIWGIPVKSAIEAIPEFRRVTKKGGLFIVTNESIYPSSSRDSDTLSETLDTQLKKIILPGELSHIPVYQNYSL